MSIRTKTLLLVTITILVLIGSALTFASVSFLGRFDRLEISQARDNADRIGAVYTQMYDYLMSKISDWGVWDDAYAFIEDNNKEFIKSNLEYQTLLNLKIDLMMFVRVDGIVVYEFMRGPHENAKISVPISLISLVTSTPYFMDIVKGTEGKYGTVLVDNKPLTFAIHPVLKSDGTGPSNGFILFGTWITDASIQALGESMKLPLTHKVLAPGTIDAHVQEELSTGEDMFVVVEDIKTIEADKFVYDIFDKPIIYLHLELPRKIHAEGLSLVHYIGSVVVIEVLVLIALLWIILERLILRRVLTIGDLVKKIGANSEPATSLSALISQDEVGILAQTVQRSFVAVELSRKKIKEQQLEMRQYFDHAGVMIVVISSGQTIMKVNKKMCDVSGYSESELIGKNWFDTLIPERDREKFKGTFQKLMAGEIESFEYVENPIVTKAGVERVIGWHNSLLKNDQGIIVASLSSGDDITERSAQEIAISRKNDELEHTKTAVLNILDDQKKLEEQIKLERDRANMIVSTMTEGLFVVDTKKRVLLVNISGKKLTGYTEDDLIGKKLTEITALYKENDLVREEDRLISRTLQTGESYSFGLDAEYHLQGKGEKIPVAISTVPLRQENNIIGAIVTFRDITKDKEVTQTIEQEVAIRTRELHDERAKLIASINSLNMGYMLMDMNGKPLIANSQLSSIFGSNNTVMTIADIDEMFGSALDLSARFSRCIQDKQISRESDINFRGKILKVWLVPVIVTVNAQDKVIGAVLLVEDITERKVLERSKDEFFSIASHELRTPLTAIRGNTSMILDFYAEQLKDKELKEMIDDIHASSIRLIDIVNDFLNVSRIEQGKIEFKYADFDCVDLAKESVAEFEGAAREKQVTIRVEAPVDPLPAVYADRDRSKQAILNLIGNSLKFTETGEIQVKLYSDAGFIRIDVIDHGRGIPKENQSLLFHKFQQAGSSLFTRDTTKGTGLGLYISRLLIEGMRGKIWLEKSEEGVGSTFSITLPIAS